MKVAFFVRVAAYSPHAVTEHAVDANGFLVQDFEEGPRDTPFGHCIG